MEELILLANLHIQALQVEHQTCLAGSNLYSHAASQSFLSPFANMIRYDKHIRSFCMNYILFIGPAFPVKDLSRPVKQIPKDPASALLRWVSWRTHKEWANIMSCEPDAHVGASVWFDGELKYSPSAIKFHVFVFT